MEKQDVKYDRPFSTSSHLNNQDRETCSIDTIADCYDKGAL